MMTFSKQFRLLSSVDFKKVYSFRNSRADAILAVYAMPNGAEFSRVGLSVSKKVGNAVVRNRWKRLIREAFRLKRLEIPTGFDYIVVPKRGASPPSYAQLEASLLSLTLLLKNSLKKYRRKMTLVLPKGYRFAAVHAGLKSDPALFDLTLIVSDYEASAAGVYTQNLVCGAPVSVCRERTPGNGFRAVAINSRCANACTGQQGIDDAKEMAAFAAKIVGAPPDKSLVMSTGVIGTMLPMQKIEAGIQAAGEKLKADEAAFIDAARGMMTTDTFPKFASKVIGAVTIAGMCKGAAMIGPNMATLLAVVITDAAIEPQLAQKLIQEAADSSFNCISVEGHTSTSDTLVLLANGASGVSVAAGTKECDEFSQALTELCKELAIKIPQDGEGCSHLITINVSGCKDRESAKTIAKTIANDALVKTAICGADPNWGRIVSAAGRAGVAFEPMRVSLKINGIELYKNGTPIPFDKTSASNSIRQNKETRFDISFGEGESGTTFWTTDLTAEYVRLNADYTT